MYCKKYLELIVGLFVLICMFSLSMLAFRVSGMSWQTTNRSFHIRAEFDNVGGLKIQAPVVVAGVKVGEVDSINLNSDTFRANVHMRIDKTHLHLPIDSSAQILTHGLLGANYVGISPGFGDDGDVPTYLKEGSLIVDTQPAIVLENLISHIIFNMKKER